MTGKDALNILNSFTDEELNLELKIFDHQKQVYDLIDEMFITQPPKTNQPIIQLYRK